MEDRLAITVLLDDVTALMAGLAGIGGEDDVAAIRSACALLAGALELSLDQD